MLPTVWLKPGILIIYGAAFDAVNHKHNAIQFIWPVGKSICQIEDKEITGTLIIGSQVEHKLHMEAGWVLLIEPQSNLGQQLLERLAQQSVVCIPEISGLSTTAPKQEDDPAHFLSPLFSELGLDTSLSDANTFGSISDKRIQHVLSNLEQCLPGDCIKPEAWRAGEIAKQLALSESRFLHLFSEQMGISWRPYLLWRRTICAVNAITKGKSATDAAHLAGFSDSSHLSRTFRSLFGMSIREAKSLIQPD